ncbi:major facilitator superfamily transporter [Apiospora marii]|uniref:Major facilitator superfamily transporter n=1 Tax=Apiospora marii TaxID=335849 RepID=A0ABR1RNP8_9PEZI
MCLCFSFDIVWPIIGLVIPRSVLDDDQALAGGVLQTVGLVGRGTGLALAAAVQVDVLQPDTGLLLPVTDWPLMCFVGP